MKYTTAYWLTICVFMAILALTDVRYLEYNATGTGNPLLPKYFSDPTFLEIYVDRKLDNQEQKNLLIHENCNTMKGFSEEASEYFNGYIASLRMREKAFLLGSVQYLIEQDKLRPD